MGTHGANTCTAFTLKDERCSRRCSRYGGRYCQQHYDKARALRCVCVSTLSVLDDDRECRQGSDCPFDCHGDECMACRRHMPWRLLIVHGGGNDYYCTECAYLFDDSGYRIET